MAFYNTHTHIFNVPCVPDAFVANYGLPPILARLARGLVHNAPLRKTILALLKKLPFRFRDTPLKRYVALIEVALHKYQSDVFDTLHRQYLPDARFVVLTMNFDYMTGIPPADHYNHYPTQWHETLEVKKLYGSKVLPFLFIDPRMGRQGCMDLIRRYFDMTVHRGVVGIKLYPPLGYYPFHPDLEPVYEFAEKHRIPIITHAYKSGGAYFTGRFTAAMMSYDSFHPTPQTKAFLNEALNPFETRKPPRYYADILMHPILYHDVLACFPQLKICLAHFGGDAEIMRQDDTTNSYNYTAAIKDLMRQYDHVYTDVSYTLAYPQANARIRRDMQDPELTNRILFGTDFFLTQVEKKETDLVSHFLRDLEPYRTALTETNPGAFLSSSFYTP